MEARILKAVYEGLNKGEVVALATITDMKGSTPRDRGSMMAIWADGRNIGSVGGGNIEFAVIEKAKACIEALKDEEVKYDLTDEGDLHMQCGGKATVFIKVFKPQPKMIIAGAGHVGIELYKIAKQMNFYTVILDDREEFANAERFPEADEIIVGNIGEQMAAYPVTANTYIIIVTRGHASDGEALKAVAETEAKYIGMIGSKKKTEFLMKKLLDEGVSRQALEKVYAPVGLDISSEEPNEIALGIVAEMLLIKNEGSLKHLREIKKINF